MLFGWNLTLENTTFSSILIRWTNLTNVLNRKVRHYIVFLNRRNNSVTLHQIVSGDRSTTEINGLTHSTNYSVEVVGIDTMGKPYKTPSEATKTANRKRGNAFVFFFYFCEFVFCYSVEVVGIDTVGKPYKTPSEATMTTNRKRGSAFVVVFVVVFYLLVLRKVFKLSIFNYLRGKSDQQNNAHQYGDEHWSFIHCP